MANYTIGEMVWKVTGDKSGLDRTLKSGEKQVSKTAQIFKKAATVIGGALIAIGIGKFVKSIIGAASEAEETANKFGVVFSRISKDANAVAKSLAIGYGYSTTAAKDLLSSTANIAQGLGYTQEKSLKLSDTLVRLGSDITSFTNYAGGSAQATQILTKALLGERDALQALDLKVTQNELDNLAKSHGEVYNQLTQQQQAELTLSVIMKKSKNAMGDFERSMGSYANQMRIASANVDNLQEGLGSALLPIVTLGIRAFNSLASSLQDSITELNNFIKSAEGAEKIGNIIGTVIASFMTFKTFITPILKAFGNALIDIIKPFRDISTEGIKLETVMYGLAKFVTIAAASIRILGAVVSGIIKSLIDLGVVAWNTAKLVGNVFAAASGRGNIDEMKKNFASLLEANKQFGSDIIDTYDNVKAIVNETVAGFDEITKGLGEKTKKEFLSTQESISKSVQSVLTAVQETAKGSLSEIVTESKSAQQSWEEFAKKLKDIDSVVQMVGQNIINLFQSIQNLQNVVYQNRIDQLDAQMQAELEAAGVAEESAVESAQNQLTAAQEAGDQEAIAAAEKALTKAKIEEAYEKKRRQLQYQAQFTRWKWEVSMASAQIPLSTMNAIASGAQAPWFLQPGFMIAMGITAGAAAAANLATVLAAKPEPPKFAEGGIVPGTGSTDSTLIAATPGEMVLNKEQQAALFGMANAGGRSGDVYIYLGTNLIYKEMYRASKNGDLIIYAGAVTSK